MRDILTDISYDNIILFHSVVIFISFILSDPPLTITERTSPTPGT